MTLSTKLNAPTGVSYFRSAHEQTGFWDIGPVTASEEASSRYVPIRIRGKAEVLEPIWDAWRRIDMTQAVYLRADVLDAVCRQALANTAVARPLHTLTLNTVDRVWTRVAAGLEEIFKETPFEAFLSIPERVEHPATRAFDDLVEWLEADDAEVANAAGLGRTTRYAWSRESHAPRASKVRRLYQIHAAVESLRRALGPGQFARWLNSGDPNHRDILLEGRTDAIQPAIREYVFRPFAKNLPDLAAAPELVDEIDTTESPATEAPRPSGRRRRTARV